MWWVIISGSRKTRQQAADRCRMDQKGSKLLIGDGRCIGLWSWWIVEVQEMGYSSSRKIHLPSYTIINQNAASCARSFAAMRCDAMSMSFWIIVAPSCPAMSGQCPAWKCSRTIVVLSRTGQKCSMKSQGSTDTGMILIKNCCFFDITYQHSKQRQTVANSQDHRRERGKQRWRQWMGEWKTLLEYVLYKVIWCTMIY